MALKYVQLLINDQTLPKGGKSTIERYYGFLESSAAQEAKLKLAFGLVTLIADRKPKSLVVKGDLIGETPTFGYSSLAIALETEGQKYHLNIGSRAQKKEKPYSKNSEVRLSISSDNSIQSTQLGRLFPSYLRTFEDSLVHYRQEELNSLGNLLGGLEHPLFGLQREFGMSADQALAALDKGISLEQLAKELLEQKGKRK